LNQTNAPKKLHALNLAGLYFTVFLVSHNKK
jgi:hypothetical protein